MLHIFWFVLQHFNIVTYSTNTAAYTVKIQHNMNYKWKTTALVINPLGKWSIGLYIWRINRGKLSYFIL